MDDLCLDRRVWMRRADVVIVASDVAALAAKVDDLFHVQIIAHRYEVCLLNLDIAQVGAFVVV